MHPSNRPPPPPPKDIFFKQPKPLEPEELTELIDDDLEQWAAGGTRILPKSYRPEPINETPPPPSPAAQQMQSFPPVAYMPSMPPPHAASKSNAAVWAAVIGMTSVFAIAALAGVAWFVHSRATAETAATTTASTTTESVVDPVVQAAPPPPPVVTAETVETAAPIATLAAPPVQPARKATVAVAAPPPVAKADGTLQTFAAGSGKPVFVDGKQVGMGGTRIKTTCGKHSISVGSGRAKTFDVPCNGGAITVGSPDGN